MKKGDQLLCNDGETIVELFNFDSKYLYILYQGKKHQRARSQLGKTLHYVSHCWSCGCRVSSYDCEKCDYCGWYICPICGSCHKDECVYFASGFDKNGIHRNGTRFADNGYDVEGYDRRGLNKAGFDRQGYDKDGYNQQGLDSEGFDRAGFDCDGYDREGYNKSGYNFYGYDRNGYNKKGFNSNGIHQNGTRYSNEGFDIHGYDRNGYNFIGRNRKGFDVFGYDRQGYDEEGYDRDGFDHNGIDREGCDKNGLNAKWRSLINRKVAYIGANGNIKKGTVTKCYRRAGIYYVDVQFIDGQIYSKIDYNHARSIGILKFLIKKPKI